MTEDQAREFMSEADERAILILNFPPNRIPDDYEDGYYELNGGTEAFDDLHLERYSDKERSQFVFLRNY